jgi:hypothetical protein
MRKVKGIPIWEQYIELMVLGAVSAIVVALLLLQFLGPGNVVNDIRPDQINHRLTSEAQRIETQLAPDAPPPIPPRNYEPVFPSFAALLKEGIGVEPTLPRLGPDLGVAAGGERIGPGAIYTVPVIPAASVAAAQQYYDGLEETVLDEHPSLRERWSQAPYDISWVTVAALVNTSTIMQRFREGGNGAVAPPSTWYRDRVTFVDVRVERERYMDGQWGERTELKPLPGQVSFRAEIAREVDARRRDEILAMLHEPGGEVHVVRPPFFTTRSEGQQWPDPRDPGDGARDIPRMIRTLQLVRAQRDEAQRELDELRGSRRPDDDRRSPTPGRAPTPERRGPSGPGGPAPGPGPSPGPSPGPERGPRPEERQTETRIRDLERSVNQLSRNVQRLEGILREAGVNVDNLEKPAQTDEELVWAHDINVEPGNTYRYRVVYDVYNPFFARRLHLTEEQHRLADQFVLSSEAAEWSEPVHVKPSVHMYVTRAFPAGQDRAVGGAAAVFGSATVEVFRFHDGRWWSHSFTVEPGQRIGGVRDTGRRGEPNRPIDFTADWFVLDVIQDTSSEAARDREGRMARVVLQHVGNGAIKEIRHPALDTEDPFRQRLLEHTQLARLE